MDRTVIPFVSDIAEASRQAWLDHLQTALPEFQIEAFDRSADYVDADVAIVANPDPQQLAQLPELKWVQSLWAGVEKLVHSLPSDIAIVRMVDPQLARTMAEAVLTMTLSLHRDLPLYAAQQAAGIWEQHTVTRAKDRKVGVLGLGALGRAACEALSRNGFDVLGWSRSPKSLPDVQCFSGDEGLTDFLRLADIVVILLPLTDETRGLLDHTRLSQMKPAASLINFARASIIDHAALVGLLENGHVRHAVLDVFEVEPLTQHDPLWNTKGVTILPHVSAPTNMTTASQIAANNIRAFFETGQVPQAVDRARGY